MAQQPKEMKTLIDVLLEGKMLEDTKPPTVGEGIEILLKDKGCPDDVVRDICNELMSRPGFRLNEFWDKEYKKGMRIGLFIVINTAAREFIEENYPDAWFKHSFCPCDVCTGKEHEKWE